MPSKTVLERKEQITKETAKKFEDSVSTIVVDYRGLNVADVTELRRQLTEAGVQFEVIKNAYLKRAAQANSIDGLDDAFVGPTAVAFSNEDVVAPAKILSDFAKDHDVLQVKGGVIEGKVASIDEINAIAKLPSREGLLSMLLSVLQAPTRNVAYAVKAVADSKNDDEPAA